MSDKDASVAGRRSRSLGLDLVLVGVLAFCAFVVGMTMLA